MSFLPRNPQYLRIVQLTQAEINSATAEQIADYATIYQLNTAPFDRYVSDGTSLVLLASTSTTAIEQALTDLSSSIGTALDLSLIHI